ncbi:MAG: hypothetical protein KAT77_00710 [Nanoarchaeota archaeon]|nr:hypothetical protein [Nanoarchaeota archaeon]
MVQEKRVKKTSGKSSFFWFMLGAVITIIVTILSVLATICVTEHYTLRGYELSFPDYPNLISSYQSRVPIRLSSFTKDNLPERDKSASNINHYVANISFRLINKGRPSINNFYVAIVGEDIYYHTLIIETLEGMSGYIDLTLPLIFKCEDSEKCGLNNIPLGKKGLGIWVWCDECSVKPEIYPLEICVYDDININQEEYIDKLNYFPK